MKIYNNKILVKILNLYFKKIKLKKFNNIVVKKQIKMNIKIKINLK